MPKLTVTLPDGSTKELPEGFPTSQQELDAIRDRALAPKLQQIAELNNQVSSLTGERDALSTQVGERDASIDALKSSNAEKDRNLLVTQVAHAKGVPAKWLNGDDQAALEASADEFLADARGLGGTGQPSPPGTPENPQPAPTPPASERPGGYVGSAGTGNETPARPSFEEAKEAAKQRTLNQQKGSLTP